MKGRSATERQGRSEAAGGRERLTRGERNEWTGREERMGGGPEGQGPRDPQRGPALGEVRALVQRARTGEKALGVARGQRRPLGQYHSVYQRELGQL